MKRLLSALCLSVLLATPASATLSTVQFAFLQGSGSDQVPGQVVFSTAPTAGDLITCGLQNGGDNTFTINTSNWTQLGDSGVSSSPGGQNTVALYRYAQAGDSATLPAFTSAGSSEWSAACYETSGVAGSITLDLQTVSGSIYQGGLGPPSVQQITQTANTIAYCFAGTLGGSNTTTAPSGWTADVNHTGGYGLTVAMSGSFSTSGTLTSCDAPNYTSRIEFVIQASVPTHPWVRSNATRWVFNRSSNEQEPVQLAPIPGDLMISYVDVEGQTPAPTLNTTAWTMFDEALNVVAPHMIGLERYAQNGDTFTLPEYFTDTIVYSRSFENYEIAGVTGNWTSDFQSSKNGYSALSTSITSTTDTTQQPNTLAVSGFGTNNHAEDSTAPTNSANWAFDGVSGGSQGIGQSRTFASKSSSVTNTVTFGNTGDLSYVQALIGAAAGGTCKHTLAMMGAGC